MNKFKQLLFLKNIKRVGKTKINDNYLELLNEFNDIDDLISEMQYKFNFKLSILEDAKIKAEELYESIVNDSSINVITVFDDDYPDKLNIMGNKKPLILYVKGNVDCLKKSNISIIGTRNPSKLSEYFEKDLVKNIVNTADRVVVSGLALGCDKIAHQTTVDENKVTIAVLPSGLNNIKPATNKNLAEKIIKTGGCLISEYEPDKPAYKSTYVERDKIVAAFSDATFVVECGIKSGTMHTVIAASEYQRQLYIYLPNERPDDSYDGNEFILNEKNNSIKVDDIGEFLADLETLNMIKQPKTGQQTLM